MNIKVGQILDLASDSDRSNGWTLVEIRYSGDDQLLTLSRPTKAPEEPKPEVKAPEEPKATKVPDNTTYRTKTRSA